MKQFRDIFAPLALMATGVLAEQEQAVGASLAEGSGVSIKGGSVGNGAILRAWLARLAVALPADSAHQANIEQRFSIRVTPVGPMMPPDVLIELRQGRRGDGSVHFVEHKMGRCVAWSNIIAVEGAVGNRLLLFMRDQHIISIELEKICRARDFYSGFLFERTRDGRICAGRDVLHARSGANCRIRHFHALMEMPARRF